MKIDITPIIEIITAILCAIMSVVVIPYIKQRLSSEKYEKLKSAVQVAVEAAEQLFKGQTGQQKKEYVVACLLSKGIVFDVDEVTTLIESEVYKLKKNS